MASISLVKRGLNLDQFSGCIFPKKCVLSNNKLCVCVLLQFNAVTCWCDKALSPANTDYVSVKAHPQVNSSYIHQWKVFFNITDHDLMMH